LALSGKDDPASGTTIVTVDQFRLITELNVRYLWLVTKPEIDQSRFEYLDPLRVRLV
jgi:hypothetical protein